MGNIFSQFYFIPAPQLTEKNCPDQTGRVFLVTGGYAGVGFELCKILYAHNATVWVAGRSAAKAQKAISSIKEASPNSNGRLEFLYLDLSDLSTIKPAVHSFLARQDRLDVLVNNAGVMYPPRGSTDAQGNELQVGTNCLGPYLLYQLLLPVLARTAASPSSLTGSVRVAWAASIAVHVDSPKPGIVVADDGSGRPTDQGVGQNYGQTKVGNVFLAREFAKTTPRTGVVHAAFNPGNLRTELQRHWTGVGAWLTDKCILYPPIYGAYTELWTILAPELTPDKSGAYVYPWGRFGSLPAGVEASMKGDNGVAAKFVEWCGKQTEAFM
ncbi:short-chain alcohol dehydrogenase [Madurella fahalii]|uniref:Short-chain alcohol dehydrogenase n=1 Tax=Madurella fahalii TaxID=1157608 RepID=A0ABQ0GNK2_9PEZI